LAGRFGGLKPDRNSASGKLPPADVARQKDRSTSDAPAHFVVTGRPPAWFLDRRGRGAHEKPEMRLALSGNHAQTLTQVMVGKSQ